MKIFDLIWPKPFVIHYEPMSPEDHDSLRDLIGSRGYGALLKLLQKRIQNRTEDLVNGQDTRKQIEELKDLILELESYANPA